MSQIVIRPAVKTDAALILKFIKDLARYEKAEDQVIAQVTDIERTIFGPDATVEAIICTLDDTAIGFAVYFYNYSTWQGKNGLYLEDLYVDPEFRNVGAGKAMLKFLAQNALAKNCGRFEWNVLDWNEPAIQFYESIGAKPKSEWVGYQLAGEALEAFSRS
ncbi:hypothetical protein TDB9533_00660 [Thalassocella blandensis]|nr:hypothetical protein TDB9533_00660 [Thalassocella blandensis]